jgi:hypothetical protein
LWDADRQGIDDAGGQRGPDDLKVQGEAKKEKATKNPSSLTFWMNLKKVSSAPHQQEELQDAMSCISYQRHNDLLCFNDFFGAVVQPFYLETRPVDKTNSGYSAKMKAQVGS